MTFLRSKQRRDTIPRRYLTTKGKNLFSGPSPAKEVAQVNLINTAPSETLEESWNEFFVHDHYGIHTQFRTARLARFPRRTCDAFAGATLLSEPWAESNPLPEFQALEELQKWAQPLIDEEVAYRENGSPLGCTKGYGKVNPS